MNFDSSGNLWVADLLTHHINEFSSTGAFIREFSTGVQADGVAVDSSGNVWISDASNERIVEYALVPEPSSIVIGSMGAVGLCLIARRRRNQYARGQD